MLFLASRERPETLALSAPWGSYLLATPAATLAPLEGDLRRAEDALWCAKVSKHSRDGGKRRTFLQPTYVKSFDCQPKSFRETLTYFTVGHANGSKVMSLAKALICFDFGGKSYQIPKVPLRWNLLREPKLATLGFSKISYKTAAPRLDDGT